MTLWFAVRSMPGSERLAAESISNVGAEPFVPFIRTVKGHLLPLFTRYLFCTLPFEDSSSRVCRGRGVDQILPHNSLARVPVRKGLIESLMSIQTQRGGFVVDEMPVVVERSALVAGQQVEIISGMYAGAVTTLLQARGNTGRLMLALFGRETSVAVRLDQLRAA